PTRSLTRDAAGLGCDRKRGLLMSGIRASPRLVVAFLLPSALLFPALPSPVGAAGAPPLTHPAPPCPAGPTPPPHLTPPPTHPPDPITTSRLNGHGSKTANERGNLKYSHLTAGTRTITLVSDNQPFEFLHLRVFCSVPSTGIPAVEKTVKINDLGQDYFRYAL